MAKAEHNDLDVSAPINLLSALSRFSDFVHNIIFMNSTLGYRSISLSLRYSIDQKGYTIKDELNI